MLDFALGIGATVILGLLTFLSAIGVCPDFSQVPMVFPLPFCLNPDLADWGVFTLIVAGLQFPLYACAIGWLYRELKRRSESSLFPQLIGVLVIIHGIAIAVATIRTGASKNW